MEIDFFRTPETRTRQPYLFIDPEEFAVVAIALDISAKRMKKDSDERMSLHERAELLRRKAASDDPLLSQLGDALSPSETKAASQGLARLKNPLFHGFGHMRRAAAIGHRSIIRSAAENYYKRPSTPTETSSSDTSSSDATPSE